MEPGLLKKFPEIKSYSGQGVGDPRMTMRCDYSPRDFEAADTQLRSPIPASLTVTDIRRGQVGDSDARSQLLSALNQGAKVVNYYGHGSTTVWTDAPILSASDTGDTNSVRSSMSRFTGDVCGAEAAESARLMKALIDRSREPLPRVARC